MVSGDSEMEEGPKMRITQSNSVFVAGSSNSVVSVTGDGASVTQVSGGKCPNCDNNTLTTRVVNGDTHASCGHCGYVS